MTEKLKIAFVWHFHQPSYQENENGRFLMPWARFHATKDYLAMLKYVDDFKNLKLNFNITPILLKTLEKYAQGFLDVHAQYLLCDETKIQEKDKLFILDNFFDVNIKMLEQKNYYTELYNRKLSLNELDINAFNNQEYIDIIANYNLCWINKRHIPEYKELKQLIKKEKNYTLEDRKTIYEISKDIISRIIPEFKKHQDEGKIEISTSPYSHPIIPLVLNMQEMPCKYSINLPLDAKIMADDAKYQVKTGIEEYEKYFGRKPAGIWLSEQCISPATVKLLDSFDIKWTIAEYGLLEETLNKESLRDFEKNIIDPFFLASTYKLKKYDNTNIIFSDSYFANLISFTYGSLNPKQTAMHLYDKLKYVQNRLENSPNHSHLITIAMDGENCWESYEENGFEFLNTLYSLIEEDETIETTLLSEYLDQNKETISLEKLSSGSWINKNFDLWIGEPIKNLAWSYINKTIEDFKIIKEQMGNSKEEKNLLKQARHEILVAQGSDWFWWYGEPNDSGRDYIFDHLFREKLKNTYRILNREYPAYLDLPLTSLAGKPIKQPRKQISPQIDGKRDLTSDNWKDAGCIFLPDSPTFSNKKLVKGICYGADNDYLYFKIELNKINMNNMTNPNCQIYIYITKENAKYSSVIKLCNKSDKFYPVVKNKFSHEIRISIDNNKLEKTRLANATQNNLWVYDPFAKIKQAYEDTIEVAVPYDDLKIYEGQSFSFCFFESHDGLIEEVYPQDSMIRFIR